jgi:hypothetical protein
MMTVDDAARRALELPDVAEGTRNGRRTWSVNGKGFASDRISSGEWVLRGTQGGGNRCQHDRRNPQPGW